LLADIEPIEAFLTRKWKRELDYRLIKKLWYPRGLSRTRAECVLIEGWIIPILDDAW
jgi:nuclear transport factor 2 (NTF2) superfamily protein